MTEPRISELSPGLIETPETSEHSNYVILKGDSRELVSQLPVINCVMCSPPYFQKQKYGDLPVEIGKERDVEDYIKTLVDIFNAVPLHHRGSVWINIGDKRDNHGGLMSIPERLCLAMQNSGWHRADSVIWAKIVDFVDGTTKGGCMIEPANGRLNGNGYEYLYRFVKTEKVSDAWTDMCAVGLPRQEKEQIERAYLPKELMTVVTSIEGRRLHNVWQIPMGQTSKLHYACYHRSLCERPIVMTCPLFVDESGNPVGNRIVVNTEYDEDRGSKRVFGKYNDADLDKSGRMDTGRHYIPRKPVTVGWESIPEGALPGIVLDPFCGTGVTGQVALATGRGFIGIDLYDEYVDMSRKTCEETAEFLRVNKLNPANIIRADKHVYS